MDWIDVEAKLWNDFLFQLPDRLAEHFNRLMNFLKLGDVMYRVIPSYNNYKSFTIFRPRPGHYPNRIHLFLQRSW